MLKMKIRKVDMIRAQFIVYSRNLSVKKRNIFIEVITITRQYGKS